MYCTLRETLYFFAYLKYEDWISTKVDNIICTENDSGDFSAFLLCIACTRYVRQNMRERRKGGRTGVAEEETFDQSGKF